MYDFNVAPSVSDFEKVVLSDSRLRKTMKTAQKHVANGDWDKAMPSLMAIWKAMPENPDALMMVAHALVLLGVREEAIGVLKQYLANHAPTPEVCSVMMALASAMEIYSVAEKLGKILLEMEPGNPSYYCDYIMVLIRQEKYDEAIEVCQSIIPIFKEHAELWNVLGAAVQYRDGFDQSIVFYEEALRLNPKSITALHNISMAAEVVGGYEKSKSYLERAYKLSSDNVEVNMGLAFCNFWNGNLEPETWRNYACRLSPTRSNTQHILYTHKRPLWNGEDLSDKTLFVTCEQGLGDEVMFGSILPEVYVKAKQLVIGVDHRLISLMERRFPNAIVGGYGDHIRHGYRYRTFHSIQALMQDGELDIDYACPLATVPSFYWNTPESVQPPKDPLLKPDLGRSVEFKERLEAITSKPLIGIAWTSGNKASTRSHDYPRLSDMAAIFELKDKYSFLNLQYGDAAEDIAFFKSEFGVELIDFDDVNLKADIEANVALIANCDSVISVMSAPGMFSMTSGCKTIIMTCREPWWVFGNPGSAAFAKDGTVVVRKDWAQVCQAVAEQIN